MSPNLYECENCSKELDSNKRKKYDCPKCGGIICAVCVVEVKSEYGVSVMKHCPICNELLSVD